MHFILKYRIYGVLAVCVTVFALGYFIGQTAHTQVIDRPSSTTYLKMAGRIDSLKKILPHAPDTVFRDEHEIVVLYPSCYVNVLRKFSPKKSFRDYPVAGRHSGKIPSLDFSTCKYGKRYITMTKRGVEQGVQFAGYYAFAWWGCGAPCQMCAIVDLRTGNVYAGPLASGGYEFKVDSRILVVNPPDSNGYYYANSVLPGPEQYLWTGNTFVRLE